MKKLMAIMMALVMCCTLVISASATSIDTDYYSLDLGLDGEWTDDGETATFFTDYSEVYVTVYTDYTSDELIKDYNELLFEYETYASENPDTCTFASGDFSGCPGFGFAEVTDAAIESMFIIISDEYAYEIVIISEDVTEFQTICTNIDYIDIYSSFSGDLDYDYGYEEDYVEDDYEEEEIVEEEEEEDEDEKKPSKDDKDDKDDKKDKEDKDDKDDEKKDNTTLIIIIVAGVAVVAIAAVVIVLVTKKKQ